MMWRVFAVVLGLAPAAEAVAGAWTLPEGEGQVFFSSIRRVAPAGAQFSGLRDEDELFSAITVEYGLLDRLTLGAALTTKYDTTRPEDVEIRAGGHLRYRVWSGGGQLASVQIGGLAPVETLIGPVPESQPDSVPEISVTALYGRGWQGDWGQGFLSAGLGGAWRGEGKDDEIRAELTVGQRPWRHFMGTFSVFATVPMGDEDASVTIAPAIAYTAWPWLGPNDKKPLQRSNPNTVQLGVSWDPLNPEDGLAITLNLWKRF